MEFFEGGGWPTGNPSGFIAAAQESGLGVTAARNAFREAGGRISNQTFSNLWGEINASSAARQAWQGENLAALPRDELISRWTTPGSESGYLYHMDLQVRVAGTDEVFSKLVSWKSQQLHSPADMMDSAIQTYSESENYPGESVVGAVFLNVFELAGE